jgi:hypothetical protein
MWRVRQIAGQAVLALLILGGCGGEGESEPAMTEPQGSEEAPAPAESAAPPDELRHTPPDPEAVGVEGDLPADVPVPASAQATHPPLIAAGTTRASYDSAEPLAALHSFYKQELATSGWTLGDERSLEGQVLLSATKDARRLSVAISESDGRSQFVLLIEGE